MARFVLPQAEGNAAQIYFLCSSSSPGLLTPIINICSANQPSFLASVDPKRRAKHFLPSKELPPYPEPKLIISLVWGLCVISTLSGLQGQFTSFIPFSKGHPTEWRHLINCPSSSAIGRRKKLITAKTNL